MKDPPPESRVLSTIIHRVLTGFCVKMEPECTATLVTTSVLHNLFC